MIDFIVDNWWMLVLLFFTGVSGRSSDFHQKDDNSSTP